MTTRILFLFGNGVEELELFAPVDILRRSGVEVVMATVGESMHVTGRSGVVFHADASLGTISADEFDALVLPGGPGVFELRKTGEVSGVAKRFFDAGKPVAAICAAPALLADAGILAGKKWTGHECLRAEFPNMRVDHAVEEDGLILTSRGAGTAVEFGLTLVERFCGTEKRAEIAHSIHAE